MYDKSEIRIFKSSTNPKLEYQMFKTLFCLNHIVLNFVLGVFELVSCFGPPWREFTEKICWCCDISEESHIDPQR
jgi:hypothetical protein